MATDPYVYVGNALKGDGTSAFKFRSSEDNSVYLVVRGSQIELNAADYAKLSNTYIFVPAGEEPGSPPLNRPLEFIDEGTIPVGYVLKKTVRGFEFELDSGEGGGSAHVIQDDGTNRTQRMNLNFVGDGVAVTDDSDDDATVVTISGGGGGGGVPDDNSVTAAKIHTSLKGGVSAGTEALRALGATGTTAAAGNDSRFPAGADIVDADIASGAAIAESKLALVSDAAAGTASRRTLGAGATQAAAGDHTHTGLTAQAAGTPSVRAIGSTGTTVIAGNDSRLTDSRAPSGTAGGVLGGTYPNPSFAADMATQSELDAHVADETAVHGLSDMSFCKAACVHNGTTYPARPTGFASVEWIGPDTPGSAIDGDTWVPTEAP